MATPYPMYPGVNDGRNMATPRSVQTSFKLWMIGAGISVVSSIFSLVFINTIIDNAMKKVAVAPEETQQMQSIAKSSAVLGAVVGLVLICLWIALAFQMRKGKNWARITMTVIIAIGTLFTLIGLLTGSAFSGGAVGIISALLSIIAYVVYITATVFMYKSDAKAYFAAGL